MARSRHSNRPAGAGGRAVVALLRGINVGGRNKLAMADLSAIFVDAGCTQVQTYIQSGNVCCVAPTEIVARLSEIVTARIADGLDLHVSMTLRTAAQMGKIVAANPYVAAGADPAALHVAFLADRPSKARVAALDPARSPGDSFVAVGSEVYLHVPGGVARTRLTNAWLDSSLGTICTVRNWRTVTTLADMIATT